MDFFLNVRKLCDMSQIIVSHSDTMISCNKIAADNIQSILIKHK